VLVFAGDVNRRLDLVRFGTWFSQGRGVVTVCEMEVGDLLTQEITQREKEERLQRTLEREKLPAFGEVAMVRDIISGITDVAQANGMAGFDSNTILLGWPKDDDQRVADFLQVIERLERLHKSVVIGRIQPGLIPRAGERRKIDVWWGGRQHNGDLMLLLAYLLTRNPEWRDSRIRVRSLASNEHMKQATEAHLEALLPEIRISAELDVMLRPPERSVREIIHEESAEADVVFLGINLPEANEQLDYAARLRELAEPLRTVFLVKNSSLFVGKLLQTTTEVTSPSPAGPSEPSGPS
jgi:hypothetical protein